MNREQLLIAAVRAASDFAAAIDDREAQKALADKKFEFRIRFGCEGAGIQAPAETPGWSFDVKTGTLKVKTTATLSTKDAAVAALAGDKFEAVEGFWIQRPWLLTPICPTSAPAVEEGGSAVEEGESAGAAESPEEAPPTLGIAQFFTSTGPRTLRRSGRPYEVTKRIDDVKPSNGFDLVLSGQLAPLSDGRSIACTRSSAGERPACVISVEFGKVSIERADTHEELAAWGNG